MSVLAFAPVAVSEGGGALPFHQLHGYIPEPAESHHLFGAAFLLIGSLLLVEVLAGKVWHRSKVRTLLWPGAIMILGEGMVVVTLVDPNDRPIHFMVGLVMLLGGYFEARHRLRLTTLRTANMLIVPALFLGGMEIGVFHFHGDILSNSSMVHVLLGFTAGALAFVRLYQARLPGSMPRHALMAAVVMALGFELMGLSH